MFCILAKSRFMLLMIPMALYGGLESAFLLGVFTKNIINDSGYGVSNIGYVMSVAGGMAALSSAVLGHLADKRGGKQLVFCVGAIAHCSFFLLMLYLLAVQPVQWMGARVWTIYVAAMVYGIGDAALNSLLPPILYGYFFPSNADVAFAHFKFWQAMGGVLVFVLAPRMALSWIIASLFGALLVSGLCFAILTYLIGRSMVMSSPAVVSGPINSVSDF